MNTIRGLLSSPASFGQPAIDWVSGRSAGATNTDHVTTAEGHTGKRAAVSQTGPTHDTRQEGARLFAIFGNPAWHNQKMASIAASDGNAAALAVAWHQDGAAALSAISGGFAIAIIDCDEGRLQIAIDRMGIGRMVYAECDDGIVFSDKADSVACFGGQRPSVDPQAIYNYVFFHEVPSPGTIYDGVRKLGPGEILEYIDGRIQIRRYWTPEFSGSSAGDRPTSEQMLEVFRSGIRRSLPVDSVGTFLSGGLDSSTVTGLASQLAESALPAFTIGFDAAGYDEMSYAQTVAEHFGVAHEKYYVTSEDVVDSAPFIAANCDEPFGNSSIIPTYFCAKLAASHGCSTMLAGDGGDELFGGNERYAVQRVFEYFGRLPSAAQSMSRKIAAGHQNSKITLLRKFSSYVSQASVPLPDRLETYNLLTMMSSEEIFTPGFLAAVRPSEPLDMMNTVYDAAGDTDTLNRMLFLDWKFTLADNDLRKVQTGCSIAGVTPGFPLLDPDIVDFSLRLPNDLKLRGNNLRPFFRDTARQMLPDKTINKSKHGFGMPFGIWMRADPGLRAVTNEAIEAFGARNIIRRDFLNWLQKQHETDHASFYGTVIWVIMMLELWLSAKDLSWE